MKKNDSETPVAGVIKEGSIQEPLRASDNPSLLRNPIGKPHEAKRNVEVLVARKCSLMIGKKLHSFEKNERVVVPENIALILHRSGKLGVNI